MSAAAVERPSDEQAFEPLRAPWPYFGSKFLAAEQIWNALGNCRNYVEAFFGSGAALLQRPHAPKIETVNDADGLICNVWRAIKHAPDAVREHCSDPINECDLHARHRWIMAQVPLVERLIADPEWFDAKIAGWWIWGICAWIGNGWCARDERFHRSLPNVGDPGHGVHAPSIKKPITHRNKGVHRDGVPADIFERLSARLRNVRVCCGDWRRVLGRSTLGIDTEHGMTPCGILLDPPYAHELRDKRLYRIDDPGVSDAVREWALEHGDDPRLRIVLCGFEEEHAHAMPSTWRMVAWKSTSSAKSRAKERLWLSPFCVDVQTQGSLFDAR